MRASSPDLQPPFHPLLPPFLRRRRLLRAVRRLLVRGGGAEALEILAHPELALSGRADRLRSRVLEQLVRRARQAAHGGRDASARGHLEVLAREDPDRSGALTEELTLNEPGAEELRRRAMRDLLGVMRSGRRGAAPGTSGASGRAHRVHLAVDDGGEVLLALGTDLVLGHASAGQADLGFLADLESRHVRLSFSESFHAGPTWVLTPLEQKEGPSAVAVNGTPLEGASQVLGAGDRVMLGSNLDFTVDLPDPSSASVILHLKGGAECDGAARVILLPAGAGGRVTIGPGKHHHLTVTALDGEARLTCTGDELRLERTVGDGEVEHLATLSLPLAEAREFHLGSRLGGGPPIDLWIRAASPDSLTGADDFSGKET